MNPNKIQFNPKYTVVSPDDFDFLTICLAHKVSKALIYHPQLGNVSLDMFPNTIMLYFKENYNITYEKDAEWMEDPRMEQCPGMTGTNLRSIVRFYFDIKDMPLSATGSVFRRFRWSSKGNSQAQRGRSENDNQRYGFPAAVINRTFGGCFNGEADNSAI